MGRKIPGKKHKGVKDPAVQHLKRLESIKTKINAPPKNPDEQHVPKSLIKIMELTKKVKDGVIPLKTKKKKKKTGPITSAPLNKKSVNKLIKRNEKPIPVFTQQSNENDRKFIHRVTTNINDFIKETQFEEKYGVNVKRDIKSGQIIDIVRKSKENLRDPVKRYSKEKTNQKQKRNNLKEPNEAQLNKSQRRQDLLKQRKLQINLQNLDEFAEFKDEVKFGEVVHAPPVLPKPKTAISSDRVSKPGEKDLLLKSIFNQSNFDKNTISTISEDEGFGNKYNKKIKKINITNDRKGKRKNLPVVTRQLLDMQQKNVIEAYKLLKTNKVKSPLENDF